MNDLHRDLALLCEEVDDSCAEEDSADGNNIADAAKTEQDMFEGQPTKVEKAAGTELSEDAVRTPRKSATRPKPLVECKDELGGASSSSVPPLAEEDGEGGAETVNLASKICDGCGKGALEPTKMDALEGFQNRQWALKHHWGPFCMWCARMQRVRFSWLKKTTLLKWLVQLGNRRQFRLSSIAFVSLREEGKVQLTAAAIDERVDLLLRYSKMVNDAVEQDSTFMQFMLVSDIVNATSFVNPVTHQRELVQLFFDGQPRLGFAVPAPRSCQQLALPGNVVASEGVQTANSDDLRIVRELAEAALVEEAASSPAKATGVLARGSPGSGKKERAGSSLLDRGRARHIMNFQYHAVFSSGGGSQNLPLIMTSV